MCAGISRLGPWRWGCSPWRAGRRAVTLPVSATFAVPLASLFTSLPIDTTCTAISATQAEDAHLHRPAPKRR